MTTIKENEKPAALPVGFSEDEKKEMLEFCFLDSCDENTGFLNIQYSGGRQGRTCIILGAHGLHARLTGEQKGVVHNEKLGMDVEDETKYDLSLSIKRAEMIGVTIRKQELDWSTSKLSEEEIQKKPQYSHDVIISYHSGHITIHGGSLENAVMFKKIIWNWFNFVNLPTNISTQ